MSSANPIRRTLKTGHPLSLLDVFSKIIDDVSQAITIYIGNRFDRHPCTVEGKLLEAAALRRLADRHRPTSPGFAADLQAAADRHEQIG